MAPVELPHVLTAREYGYEGIRARTRSKAIVRVRRGAYLPVRSFGSDWDRRREQHLARCVAASKSLTGLYAFSHATAGIMHGWEARVDPDAVEIVQVTRPSTTRRGDLRRRVRPGLTEADIIEVAGLPVTRPLPTVLDCARAMAPVDALVTVDSALKHLADVHRYRREESLARQAVLLEELAAALMALGPRRHVARAREVLRYATGLAGSPQESRLRWLALAVGLPEPIVEWHQAIDGKDYFSDLAWLEDGADWATRAVTFEYDGGDKYGDDVRAVVRTVAEEKAREDAIASTGVAVHRVMKDRMRDTSAAARWILSKFPPSTIARLAPRPILEGPVVLLPRPTRPR